MAVPDRSDDMPSSCGDDSSEAIRLVMALSRSSSPLATALTIEETNLYRPAQWISVVTIVPMTIAIAVATVIIDCADGGDFTFPWLLLGNTLVLTHQAVVAAAKGHLMLFVPRAPFVACQALDYAGCVLVGIALTLSNIAVAFLFHQLPCFMVAWLCFLAAFVPAAIAFWICLVRTYGGNASLEKTTTAMAQQGREKSLVNTVIEGLACLYSRLLYECATNTRFGLPAFAPGSQEDDACSFV